MTPVARMLDFCRANPFHATRANCAHAAAAALISSAVVCRAAEIIRGRKPGEPLTITARRAALYAGAVPAGADGDAWGVADVPRAGHMIVIRHAGRWYGRTRRGVACVDAASVLWAWSVERA